jgi:opacity protein-like surface antigen
MKKIGFALLLCCPVGSAFAQSDDFGMWYEVEAQKKLSPKWNASLGAEFRTRDDAKTADRWSVGADMDYKILKTSTFSLKASAGYSLLYDNNPEKLTFKSDGSPKKWTPSYWGVRHRLKVGVAGSLDVGRFSFDLRERYQYTIRPEKADQRYAFAYDDDDNLVSHTLQAVKSKSRGMLRSRLQVGYNIAHCKVDPVAGVEMFSDDYGIQKMRYQIGVEWKLSKQHAFSLTYRYQDVGGDDDDNDVNSHLIGLGYKFKF